MNKNNYKTDKKNQAVGVMPMWVSKNYENIFQAIPLDEGNEYYEKSLNALQDMVKNLQKGGKLRFKINNPTPNEEGNTKPNAWLEYFTPEQVKAYSPKKTYTNNARKAASKKQDSEEDFLD